MDTTVTTRTADRPPEGDGRTRAAATLPSPRRAPGLVPLPYPTAVALRVAAFDSGRHRDVAGG